VTYRSKPDIGLVISFYALLEGNMTALQVKPTLYTRKLAASMMPFNQPLRSLQ